MVVPQNIRRRNTIQPSLPLLVGQAPGGLEGGWGGHGSECSIGQSSVWEGDKFWRWWWRWLYNKVNVLH